jgi:hypothetical protein
VYETLNELRKFATLLPNNWLAETPLDDCFDVAWQTVCGKGAYFRSSWNVFLVKTVGKLALLDTQKSVFDILSTHAFLLFYQGL